MILLDTSKFCIYTEFKSVQKHHLIQNKVLSENTTGITKITKSYPQPIYVSLYISCIILLECFTNSNTKNTFIMSQETTLDNIKSSCLFSKRTKPQQGSSVHTKAFVLQRENALVLWSGQATCSIKLRVSSILNKLNKSSQIWMYYKTLFAEVLTAQQILVYRTHTHTHRSWIN